MSVGTKRFGRYEAVHLIASGGMASVYLGRALGVGGFQRLVAIKVMHPRIARDPEFEAMFLDEGRIAAGIHHPNVVATLDVQKGEDGLYMVLELIAGCSLAGLVRKQRQLGAARLPLPIVLRIALDALAGLHAAHMLVGHDGGPLHVVHRDVSPQNILVGADGITRISDFGVARAETRIARTRQGEVKGKIAYMSPEQLRGDAVDARSDVYAMGVVLWELLAGARLFHAANEPDLVMSVLAGPQRSPRALGAAVPAELDAVCMQALAHHAQRYEGADGFAAALRSAAARTGIAIAEPADVGAVAAGAVVALPPLPPLPSAVVSEAAPSLESPPITEAPDTGLAPTLLRDVPVPIANAALTLVSDAPPATIAAPLASEAVTASVGVVRAATESRHPASRAGGWLALFGIAALVGAGLWVTLASHAPTSAPAASTREVPSSSAAEPSRASASASASASGSAPASSSASASAAPSASMPPPLPRPVLPRTTPSPSPVIVVPAPPPAPRPKYRPDAP